LDSRVWEAIVNSPLVPPESPFPPPLAVQGRILGEGSIQECLGTDPQVAPRYECRSVLITLAGPERAYPRHPRFY